MTNTMKIQIGEVQMDEVTRQRIVLKNKDEEQVIEPSKTSKYILPCLKEYGKEFTSKLNSVFKIASGVGDVIVINRGIKHEKHVYVLLDSKIASNFFEEFMDWIRGQPMYEDDYVFGDIQKSSFHMVVLKLPERFYGAFETFKVGAYSQMFTQEEITTFFYTLPASQKVFIKNHEYKLRFVRKLNYIWGTTIDPKDYDGEIDFKPTVETEIFNHHLKTKNESPEDQRETPGQ